MRELIAKILSGAPLTEAEASELLDHLTSEDLDHAQAAAALAGMRTRGETADEMRAFARGLQEIAVAPAIEDVSDAVDIVGTGGDASGSLNLSTGAALLAAAGPSLPRVGASTSWRLSGWMSHGTPSAPGPSSPRRVSPISSHLPSILP
jgi:anthranilate phosphoribosyltransferase